MLGAESYLGRQNCQVGSFDGKLPALVSHLNVAGLAFLPREERGGAAWQPGSRPGPQLGQTFKLILLLGQVVLQIRAFLLNM